MNQSLKFFLIVVAVVLLLVVGSSVGWLGSQKVTTQSPLAPTREGSDTPTLARPNPESRTAPPLRPRPVRVPAASSKTPSLTPDDLLAQWEHHLDSVLASEQTDDRTKAQELLDAFPNVPAEGQAAYAQHLSNLVTDQDYAALGRLLTNYTLPDSVLETLMSDVLNRANSVKLPALLAVARDPQHPKAKEAHEVLELTLDQDYAQDWAAWEARLQEWLTANPDADPDQQMEAPPAQQPEQ